jgi:hypothetical protein
MNALLVGGGSKWGAEYTKLLVSKGYHCHLITSSNPEIPNTTVHSVDWFNLSTYTVEQIVKKLPRLDLIFFNQNHFGGPNDPDFNIETPFNSEALDRWSRSHWIDNQLPVYIIKQLKNRIHSTTKIGWMLTGFIGDSNDNTNWKYAGYGSKKFTNLAIARGFSGRHPGIFFALEPGKIDPEQRAEVAVAVDQVVGNLTEKDSGYAFHLDGTKWL